MGSYFREDPYTRNSRRKAVPHAPDNTFAGLPSDTKTRQANVPKKKKLTNQWFMTVTHPAFGSDYGGTIDRNYREGTI